MTLLQCIDSLLSKITITDKQTESVSNTYKNIKGYLLNAGNGLHGETVFQNGSYDRDTIIRPLDDIDLFFVLKKDKYVNDWRQLPNPKTILTSVKNFLNATADYKDKVKQDRPCVTINLADKKFDVLPCFGNDNDGYRIPDTALTGWVFSNPVKHSENLTAVNKKNNKVVPLVRIIKYWNKENKKIIPSFHIEEITIEIFNTVEFTNFEEAVFHWFHNSLIFLQYDKFDNTADYEEAKKRLQKAKEKIDNAHKICFEGKEADAVKLYKEVFGDKFPTISEEEAKALNESMKSGNLKMSSTGILSTVASIAVQSTKFFGDDKLD